MPLIRFQHNPMFHQSLLWKKISNITVAIYTKYFAKNHSTTYKYLWIMCQPWLTLKPDKEVKGAIWQHDRPIDDTSLWNPRTFISSCFLNLWLEFTDSLFKSVTWYQKSMLPKQCLKWQSFFSYKSLYHL